MPGRRFVHLCATLALIATVLIPAGVQAAAPPSGQMT
jgi:hypothetical protein